MKTRLIPTQADCCHAWQLCLMAVAICVGSNTNAFAQERYYPLNQQSPTGMYGEWSGWQQPFLVRSLQPVQVQLPSGGQVTFYSDARRPALSAPSPAQAALALGHVYRLRLSGMKDHPGIDLYPTIELVDVLHPPAGAEDKYPIPVVLSAEDIAQAVDGRLVTKVIYLEPSRESNPLRIEEQNPDSLLLPNENVVEQADRRGRPMLILRLGSRTPADGEHSFFGAGAPLSATARAK